MGSFGRVLRWFGRLEMAVAILCFAAAMLLVIAQVVYRQAGASLWWAEELAQLLVLYAYFLGISHVYQVRQMIVMEFLAQRFSWRSQIRLYIFVQLFTIGFCAVVAYSCVRIMPAELRFPSYVLQVPRFYWTLPLLIGSVSMVLSCFYFTLAALRWLRQGEEKPIRSLELRDAILAPRVEY